MVSRTSFNKVDSNLTGQTLANTFKSLAFFKVVKMYLSFREKTNFEQKLPLCHNFHNDNVVEYHKVIPGDFFLIWHETCF